MKIIGFYIQFFLVVISIIMLSSCSGDSFKHTELPFIMSKNIIIVKVRINQSSDLNFILDSGNETTMIDDAVSEKLGIKYSDSIKVLTSNTIRYRPISKGNKLIVNDIVLDSIDLIADSYENYAYILGEDISGIIGYELFKRFTIHIDYDRMLLKIYTEDSLMRVANRYENKMILPLEFKQNIPYINASIETSEKLCSGRFIIDIGSGQEIALGTPFAERYNITGSLAKSIERTSYSGGNSKTTIITGRLHNFYLGQFMLKEVPVSIYIVNDGFFADPLYAGAVGNGLLQRYNMMFDYQNKKMMISPNDSFANIFKLNPSGLVVWISSDKKKFVVRKVYEDSPAMHAGIIPGDTIQEINHKALSAYRLYEVLAMINRNQGDTLIMKIKRNEKDTTCSFILKDIL